MTRKGNQRQLSLNYLYFKTEDVLSNPQNPVNPDSKIRFGGKYYIETCRGEDDACIVSTNIRGFGSFFLRSNLFPFVEWEINHAFP